MEIPLYGDSRASVRNDGEGMAAVEVVTYKELEAERVVAWRREELERAGYDMATAGDLAARTYVDLHLAIALVQGGCPPETAVRILL